VISILKWKALTNQEISALESHLSEKIEESEKGEPLGYELMSACQEWLEARECCKKEETQKNAEPKLQDNEEDKPALLSRSAARRLKKSLVKAGFEQQGPLYLHNKSSITVELCEMDEKGKAELDIEVAGLRPDDINSFRTLSLGQKPKRETLEKFGEDLIKWVEAQRNEESPGFIDEKEDVDDEQPDDEENNLMSFLPDPRKLGADSERPLNVLTWGNSLKTLNGIKAVRTKNGIRMQRNFSASGLNGRGGNVDLRTMNGLSEGVQRNVARSDRMQEWMRMVVKRIERDNLQTIAVNCSKGRHRSVAAAELLKKYYYPKAVIRHLTIR